MKHECPPCAECKLDGSLRRVAVARAKRLVGVYRLIAPELEAGIVDDGSLVAARSTAMSIAEMIVRDGGPTWT